MLQVLPPPDVCPEVPPHPEGGEWIHQIGIGDGGLIISDSATEVVGYIVPGYDELADNDAGHDEALGLRYDFLVEVANIAQEYYRSWGASEGLWDPSEESEDVLTALYSDRSKPFEGIPGPAGIELEWTHEIPLLLFVTDYDPYVPRRQPPSGRIVWLDPSDEMSFLQSITKLNIISHYHYMPSPDVVVDVTGEF